jgi:hypothetical protein
MGVFEFLMLCCFGCSWPFSIWKSLRSRSTKGKSLTFMLLIVLGYVFGIIHKILYNFNWVIWAYVALLVLVCTDITIYLLNRHREKKVS